MLDTNIAIELASNATTRKAHESALAAYQAANKRLNAACRSWAAARVAAWGGR